MKVSDVQWKSGKKIVMKTIKIIISCNSPLFCEGMASRIQQEEDMDIVGKIEDGSQAMKSLDLHPDVLILDPLLIGLEDPLQVVQKLKIKSPRTKILLLFLEKQMSDRTLMQYMASGVDGYIKRESKLSQLVEAIQTVHAGNIWAERKLLDKFVRCTSPTLPDLDSKLAMLESPLTKREKEIINYLFLGLPNKRISHTMHISETTVKTHLNNIFKKMRVHNRTQVVSTLIYSR